MTIEQIVSFVIDLIGVVGFCIAIAAVVRLNEVEHTAQRAMLRLNEIDKWDPVESRPRPQNVVAKAGP